MKTNQLFYYLIFSILAFGTMGCNDESEEDLGIDAKILNKDLLIYNNTRLSISYESYKENVRQISYSISSMNSGSGIGKGDNFLMDSVVFILINLATISDISTYKYARFTNPKHDMDAYNATLDRNFYNLDNWEEQGENILVYTMSEADFE
jgi:hypothetical protein